MPPTGYSCACNACGCCFCRCVCAACGLQHVVRVKFQYCVGCMRPVGPASCRDGRGTDWKISTRHSLPRLIDDKKTASRQLPLRMPRRQLLHRVSKSVAPSMVGHPRCADLVMKCVSFVVVVMLESLLHEVLRWCFALDLLKAMHSCNHYGSQSGPAVV